VVDEAEDHLLEQVVVLVVELQLTLVCHLLEVLELLDKVIMVVAVVAVATLVDLVVVVLVQ
jgi:hypothetical protein